MDNSFFQRRGFRVTAAISVGLLIYIIWFWAELSKWGYTVALLSVAGVFVIYYWGKRLFQIASVIALGSLWAMLLQLYPPPESAGHAAQVLLYTFFIFGVMFFGGIALISQFVLPVQTIEERRRVLGRLLLYVIGKHGPALFVKEAKLVARRSEDKKSSWPGIILVDSNSAIALERDSAPAPPASQVRLAGSGIVFTDADERLREDDLLDLRKQTRTAPGVVGLTREGIAVKASITVNFQLIQLPASAEHSRNQPAYRLNPDSGFRTIYGRAVGKSAPVRWIDLPTIVAKEIYRDMISQETLDHLFQPTSPTGGNPLADFRHEFGGRVKGTALLQERGIQMLNASVSGFSFTKEKEDVTVGDERKEKEQGGNADEQRKNEKEGDSEKRKEEEQEGNADERRIKEGGSEERKKNVVQKQRIETWMAEWKRREDETLAGGDLQADRIRQHARLEAQYEWTSKLAQIMRMQGARSKRVVVLRLLQALESAASDPSTRKLLPEHTIKMLGNVREWLTFNE